MLLVGGLRAQSVEVWSEFHPYGSTVEAREIISPAVARGGYATFRVLVTAPSGTSYFLFCQTNPPGLVDARLYKVAQPKGDLELVRSPNFGVIPDRAGERAYLLDIWVPADAEPGRRVRLELQLKVGAWIVYPMELRIQKAVVPRAQPNLGSPPTLEEVARRNRLQDNALEQWLDLLEVWFLNTLHVTNPWAEEAALLDGDEWYLKVRDLMYRRANWR